MRNTVTYEWDIETVDEHGDIQDHHHSDVCFDLIKYPLKESERLVLVRDLGNDEDGLQDRQWAYVDHTGLPEFFDGGAKVPQRLHKEIKRFIVK